MQTSHDAYRAYQNAYARKYLRRRKTCIGYGRCPKCGLGGEIYEVKRINLKTGTVNENGWEIRHGNKERNSKRTCTLASNIRIPLSTLKLKCET